MKILAPLQLNRIIGKPVIMPPLMLDFIYVPGDASLPIGLARIGTTFKIK